MNETTIDNGNILTVREIAAVALPIIAVAYFVVTYIDNISMFLSGWMI